MKHRIWLSITVLILLTLFIPVATAQQACNYLITPDEDILNHYAIENGQSSACGQGIRIGVINTAYPIQESVSALIEADRLQVYTDTNHTWSSETSDNQATKLIQTLHTVSPDAEILWYPLSAVQDFASAAEWMQNNTVNIIVNVVAHPAFADDDFADIEQFMRQAQQNNVIWLNSAGNYGNSYYETTFDDASSTIDGWHYFQGDANGLLSVQVVDNSKPLRVYLLWDQPNTDFELFALNQADNLSSFIETSTYTILDQLPMVGVLSIEPDDLPVNVFLAVFNTDFFANNEAIKFRLFVSNGTIDTSIAVSGNSIPSPNDSPDALTVGALPSSDSLITSSSSLLLSKPEIFAYGIDNVSNPSSGIASMVVAGSIARIWGDDTTQTASMVQSLLLDNLENSEIVFAQESSFNLAIMLVIGAGVMVIFALVVLWRRRGFIRPDEASAVTDAKPTSGRIFMSYRSTQRDFARKLTLDLRKLGFDMWMDHEGGIPVGADWEETLQKTIDDPQTVGMIVVLSPAYVESENCMRELRRADRRQNPMFIIPAKIEEIAPEQVPMNIQDLQYVDFTDESIYETKLTELADQIHNIYTSN